MSGGRSSGRRRSDTRKKYNLRSNCNGMLCSSTDTARSRSSGYSDFTNASNSSFLSNRSNSWPRTGSRNTNSHSDTAGSRTRSSRSRSTSSIDVRNISPRAARSRSRSSSTASRSFGHCPGCRCPKTANTERRRIKKTKKKRSTSSRSSQESSSERASSRKEKRRRSKVVKSRWNGPEFYQDSTHSFLRTPGSSGHNNRSRSISSPVWSPSPSSPLLSNNRSRSRITISPPRSPFLVPRYDERTPLRTAHSRSSGRSSVSQKSNALRHSPSTSPAARSSLVHSNPSTPLSSRAQSDNGSRDDGHLVHIDRLHSIFGDHRRKEQPNDTVLMLGNRLKMKTCTDFSMENGCLVVDSQLILMPTCMLEHEMKREVDAVISDGKVFAHAYTDGDAEMELTELSVVTSRHLIIIRRKSHLSLPGKTSVFHSHPMNAICPVRMHGHDAVLHVESLYHSVRDADSVSRKESVVLSFDPNGRARTDELQKAMKASPWVVPQLENGGIFLVERINDSVPPILILSREMCLKKTLWQNGPDYKQRIVGHNSLEVPGLRVQLPLTPYPTESNTRMQQLQKQQPPDQQHSRVVNVFPPPNKLVPRISDTVSVSPPAHTMDDVHQQIFSPTVKTPARPSVVRKLFDSASSGKSRKGTPMPSCQTSRNTTSTPRKNENNLLDWIELVPKSQLTINGPLDVNGVHVVLVTNVSNSAHLAWCMKTNNLDAFMFEPSNGILAPKSEIRIAVTFNGIPKHQQPPPNDRLEVRYTEVKPTEKFSHELFQRSAIRMTKTLAIRYNQ